MEVFNHLCVCADIRFSHGIFLLLLSFLKINFPADFDSSDIPTPHQYVYLIAASCVCFDQILMWYFAVES